MTKVFVGMSGGVDSSLAAALLREQGYDVTGVYMKNWTRDLPGLRCPWADDLADAKRVAVQLSIDFKVFDFQTDYRQKVVDYMVQQYQLGRTPNPDIMCNQEVKFKLFLDAALQDGADMIATGHYANTSGGRLLMAVDSGKDQTYFLYRVSENAVKKTLFPLGAYTKPQVRQMAQARGLFTAGKKDSQGICFVGQIGVRDFLEQYVRPQPGNVVDQQTGKVLGRHDGAIFYTLGQRHGLELGGGLPYYVVKKDMAKNEVYVTTDLNDRNLWVSRILLRQLHGINGPLTSGSYHIRIRHRAPLIEAKVVVEGGTDSAIVAMSQPERAVTAGQSVVLYNGKLCVGGGIVA